MTDTYETNPGTTKGMEDKAKDVSKTVAQDVKARAQGVTEAVASEAGDYAGRVRDEAASEVKDVSSALRTAAREMRSGSPQERTFSQIAEGLADASDAMRDKDLGEIVGAASDFARRNPVLFLGGCALAGFAATRFAKASGERDARHSTPTQSSAVTSRQEGGRA
jgi:hypothetical protein